ncbi:MAG: alpha/beta hydrolase, partial [Deltaproteobacteria bacterium]|nr:alpha/beta hydrolase [Deltaproteobacteria bacterium]
MQPIARISILVVLAAGCSAPPLSLDLMPAPGIYSDGGFDPFADQTPIESLPDFSLLYATLRRPAGEDDGERFYTNDRGKALRGGVARVEVGRENFTWEEARRVSLAKNRPDRYPLQVTETRELGIIESSIFTPKALLQAEAEATDAFATLINERLSRSRKKDVYVYVHGYKVVFENPLLVASELWHFLGYEGVMIAFSWPSTPSRWAYFADAETAMWSARGFRRLLALLSQRTDAERIHILGYSAGTRIVTIALDQIALMHHDDTREEIRARHRLGDVVLVGSDVDRELLGLYLEDGLLEVQERLTIYLSGTDKALGMSRWALGGQRRIGEAYSGELSAEAKELLWSSETLSFIDVTDAEESDTGNGHAYFRKSPW